MNTYPSSLDKLSKFTTALIILFGVGTLVAGYAAFIASGRDPALLVVEAIGPLILLILPAVLYFYRPLAVTLDSEGITIERKAGRVTIKYSDIKSIRAAAEGELKHAIRLAGNGGVFGYTGYFYNRSLGSMRLYCSQRRNYIVIDTTADKRIVISPDNPDAFLNDPYLKTAGVIATPAA